MTRKILVILAVLAVALAVATVSIEAQRGGGSRGGGSGGSGGGMQLEPNGNFPSGNYDTPTGDCGNFNGNYELPPGNYGPGNYEALDVCVSTDKRTYAEGETIKITVKAYNPLDSVIILTSASMYISAPPPCGPASYTIDGIWPGGIAPVCPAVVGHFPILPRDSYSWTFTHTEAVFPVGTGRHTVIGSVDVRWAGPAYSDPTTITVVGPRMGGGNY